MELQYTVGSNHQEIVVSVVYVCDQSVVNQANEDVYICDQIAGGNVYSGGIS